LRLPLDGRRRGGWSDLLSSSRLHEMQTKKLWVAPDPNTNCRSHYSSSQRPALAGPAISISADYSFASCLIGRIWHRQSFSALKAPFKDTLSAAVECMICANKFRSIALPFKRPDPASPSEPRPPPLRHVSAQPVELSAFFGLISLFP